MLLAEQAQAKRLRHVLRAIAKALTTVDEDFQGNAKLSAGAKRRATLVIAVALRLLGDSLPKLDAATERLVAAEVQRIETGAGRGKPAWLGLPDRAFLALDYAQYKPRGFYTKTPHLQRYFRALAWLQSIPFRVENDEELVSFMMLAHTPMWLRLNAKDQDEEEFFDLFDSYTRFLGQGDDEDLVRMCHGALHFADKIRLDPNSVAETRGHLLEDARRYGVEAKINDLLAYPPNDPATVGPLSYRIVAPYRLPDAVLFQRTTDLRHFQRPYPNGLEVLAALGSTTATEMLAGPDNQSPNLLTTIDACKELFKGGSLYIEYLHCLEPLLAGPEPDAPKFMATRPWRLKNCQTALAGWAQLRHTWVLQTKRNEDFRGMCLKSPGFVEPEPEFYNRLAALAEHTEEALGKMGALRSDPLDALYEIQETAIAMEEKLAGKRDRSKAIEGLPYLEAIAFQYCCNCLNELRELTAQDRKPPPAGARSGASAEEVDDLVEVDETNSRENTFEGLAIVKSLIDRLDAGETIENPKLVTFLNSLTRDVTSRWRKLAGMCHRLERIAHKQLAECPAPRRTLAFYATTAESWAA